MKPHPHTANQATQALTVDPHHCILIGDQPTDITLAHTIGTTAIGYANKTGKHQALTASGAEYVTDTIIGISGIPMAI